MEFSLFHILFAAIGIAIALFIRIPVGLINKETKAIKDREAEMKARGYREIDALADQIKELKEDVTKRIDLLNAGHTKRIEALQDANEQLRTTVCKDVVFDKHCAAKHSKFEAQITTLCKKFEALKKS